MKCFKLCEDGQQFHFVVDLANTHAQYSYAGTHTLPQSHTLLLHCEFLIPFFSLNGFSKELLVFFACIHYFCSCAIQKCILFSRWDPACVRVCVCVKLVLLDRFPKPFHGFKRWNLLYEIILSLALHWEREKERERNGTEWRREEDWSEGIQNSKQFQTSVTESLTTVLRWVQVQEHVNIGGVFCCFFSVVRSFVRLAVACSRIFNSEAQRVFFKSNHVLASPHLIDQVDFCH